MLVVQSQALLDAGHPSTLVVPLTTLLVDAAEPLRVRVLAAQRLAADSDLLIDQLSALDNRRFTEGPLTAIEKAQMRRVDAASRAVLDLEPD